MRKAILITAAAATLVLFGWAMRPQPPASRIAAPASTSRDALEQTIHAARARLDANPGDGEAAVLLADALMRSARVRSDASLALEAERVLRSALRHGPGDYAVRRTLAVVLLSQHRFTEALAVAREAQAARPEDAWNYAAAGDALLELGHYDEAFDAFDAAMQRRPDAPAYARVAYARELQGDLDGAVQLMQMAAEGMGPTDLEARAWTASQLASLFLLQGRLDDAGRELDRAEFLFPGHPYAAAGRVRLHVARGELDEALRLASAIPDTPESLAVRGDLHARLGDREAAERAYRDAERLEREGWRSEQPQPAALARFLAERRRDAPSAVSLAETAVGERKDVHTFDALAWAYFRTGRFDEAAGAVRMATRLGTIDPRIRCHASAIDAARRGALAADANVCDPLDLLGAPHQAIQLAQGREEESGRR